MALGLAVIQCVLPSAPAAELRLRISTPANTNDLYVEVSGEPLRVCQLQSSADLRTWTPISNFSLSSAGTVRHQLGTVRGQSSAFLRAVLLDQLPYVPGRILFSLKPSATAPTIGDIARAAGLDDAEAVVLNQASGMAGTLYLGKTRLPVPEVLAVLRSHPAIAHAEPDHVLELLEVPNDPLYLDGHLWGMGADNSNPLSPFGSQAAEVWASGIIGSTNIIVAVTDSGVQTDHPDLAGNLWVNPLEIPGNGVDDDGNGLADDVHGWNFAANSPNVFDEGNLDAHGTHVAGIIGAVGGNGVGGVGVAWHSRLMCLKFMPNGGNPPLDTNQVYSAAIRSVLYAVQAKQRGTADVRAINASWRVIPGVEPKLVRFLYEALVEAAKADILIVAGAGNADDKEPDRDNDQLQQLPSNFDTSVAFDGALPADWDAMVAVAAIDHRGNLARFSHYGANTVDLGAPGVGVVSTLPGSTYGSMDGTSMAGPFVSGAIALYASAYPHASGREIKQALLDSVAPTRSLEGTTRTGGRLDIAQMMQIRPPERLPAPTPLTPACDAIEVPLRPAFRWKPVNGAMGNVLRAAPIDGTEPERVYHLGAATDFTPSAGEEFTASRTYNWTVTALAADGRQSAPSADCRFTVRAATLPPSEAPLALSPLCGILLSSDQPDFRWTAAPRADAYLLHLYVGAPGNTPARTYTVSGATEFRIPPTEPLSPRVGYSYQIVAVNSSGEGPASAPCSFKVRDTGPLRAPVLRAPPCGDIGTRRATAFIWTPVEGATQYRFRLSVDRPDNLVEHREAVVKIPRHEVLDDEPLRGNRQYYWQVRAEADGRVGEWSLWCGFVTAFDPPTLLTPDWDRGGVRRTPTFIWTPIEGAQQYRFELSVDRPGNEVEHREAVETDTQHVIPEAEPLRRGRQYFWRVRAEAGVNLGAWTDWCRFQTAFVAPTLLSPQCESTGVRRATEFIWSPLTGAQWYRFRLSVDVPGNLVEHREARVDVIRHEIPAGDPLRGNRQYYWQVRAETDSNTGDWSEWCPFLTAFDPPILGTPKHDATGVSRSPKFTWIPVEGASRYRFRLAVDTPGNVVDPRTKVVEQPQHEIPSSDPLRGNRQYYWQVRAESDTNLGAWSDWWPFKPRP